MPNTEVFVLAPIEPGESWAYACSACDATWRGFMVETAAAEAAARHTKEHVRDERETWRDWHYGDERCTYAGCSEPLRSHHHLSPGLGQPVVVVYYDERRIQSSEG